MFDFQRLRVVKRDTADTRSFSFVGVRTNPTDGVPEFWLPQGFQSFDAHDFNTTVDWFFTLYKVMRQFAERSELRSDKKPHREPFEVRDVGMRLEAKSELPFVSFAKLNLLEKVLDSFDELVIASILTKQALRTPESYEQLHRFLDKAIYLPNDVIYLEDLPSKRYEHHEIATDLVGIFCYVYAEVGGRILDPDKLPESLRAHASAFAEKYLPVGAGLFTEDAYEATTAILKDVLTTIDRNTPYKDQDYWTLFDAVELFLYGDVEGDANEDGVLWGVSDYYPIWEDMCQVYCHDVLIKRESAHALFLDSPAFANTTVAGRRVFSGFEHGTPFYLELNGERRYLFPDFVYMYNKRPEEYEAELRETLDIKWTQAVGGVLKHVTIRANSDDGVGTIRVLRSWIEARTPAGYPKYTGAAPHQPSKSEVVYGLLRLRTLNGAISGMAAFKAARDKESDAAWIMDFKYMNYDECFSPKISSKLEDDLLKQQVYQLALQSYVDEHIGSSLVIRNQVVFPIYDPASDRWSARMPKFTPPGSDRREFSPAFTRSGVEAWVLNFRIVAEHYVQPDYAET
jgi:hypothetical protein